MEERYKIILTRISFLSALFLGVLFAYLYLWKTPGISHLLFYIFALTSALLPVMLKEHFSLKIEQKTSPLGFIFVALLLALAATSLYRVDSGVLTFQFLTLPIFYAVVVSYLFDRTVFGNLMLLKLLILPWLFGVSWIVDLYHFVKDFKWKPFHFGQHRKAVLNVLWGVLIAIPFLALFLLLFSSADAVFAEKVNAAIKETFGTWFKDFDSFAEFFARIIIGILAAIYYAVFHYSIWNRESYLRKTFAGVGQFNWLLKRGWDPLSPAVFLTMLNLLFFAFVAVQFLYLFGGNENVIGSNATFTYAEYARRGFGELLVVSLIVYGIVYTLSLKVASMGAIKSWFYKLNISAFVLMTIVICISAFMRLKLLEDAYGYTINRLWGHISVVVIGLVLLGTLISNAFRSVQVEILRQITVLALMIHLAVYLFIPLDFIVASANYNRFKATGKIDIQYMLRQTDEAVPVLYKVYMDDDATEFSKKFIADVFLARLNDKNESDQGWQSFNVLRRHNTRLMEEVVEEQSKNSSTVDREIKIFVEEYIELILEGKYDEAYVKYWSPYTKRSFSAGGQPIFTIYGHKITELPYATDLLASNVVAEQDFSIYDSGRAYINFYTSREVVEEGFGASPTQKCLREAINIKVVDGKLKIVGAQIFALGYLEDLDTRYDIVKALPDMSQLDIYEAYCFPL